MIAYCHQRAGVLAGADASRGVGYQQRSHSEFMGDTNRSSHHVPTVALIEMQSALEYHNTRLANLKKANLASVTGHAGYGHVGKIGKGDRGDTRSALGDDTETRTEN
jgi:hypothetical protein